MGSRSGWRFLLWAGAFVSATTALLSLGRLEWMTVDWSDPAGWLAGSEIEVAVAVLGRLGGLVLLAWIGVTTFVYAAARLLGANGPAIDWLSIGPFRRSVDAVLAGYLAFGSMTPAGALPDARSDPPPVTAGQVAVDPRYVPVPAGSSADDHQPPEQAEGGVPEDDRVVVEGGDHLWKVSAEHLAAALGREPTDAEIVPYWLAVIETNRDRIRSGEPDLIFPGEEIILPPLPD